MKVPKVKKREVSIHSRAARRGATTPPPKDSGKGTEETEYKPWLHNAQNAGIQKKQKKAKALTRQQKMRQQKGLEHAERNLDRLEKKVADSKNRSKKVQARRKDWEELNEQMVGKENRTIGDAEVKKATVAADKDEPKVVENVEMPDLEQPLPIRTTDMVDVTGVLPQAHAPPPTTPTATPDALAVDELDDIT